jgi:hypothetical protein
LHIGNPNGALTVEEDARGECLGFDAQIGAPPRRIQKGARRRPAATILLRCLEIAETFLVAVVVVRIARETLGRRGLDEGIGYLDAFAQCRDIEGTTVSARAIAARLVGSDFLK